MIIKFVIIGMILLVVGFIFSSTIQEFFPNTSTKGVDSLKSDFKLLTTKSIETTEEKIQSSIGKTETKLYELKNDTFQYIKTK